ncbi:hypothetical protein TSAR_000811, partial [Trichomalopsis sarcophagae]
MDLKSLEEDINSRNLKKFDICLKRAGPHNSVNCNNKGETCCVNCLYSNNKFNSQYDTKHVANDSQCCQVLINKIKKYIASTDYTKNPTFQRFISKIVSIKIPELDWQAIGRLQHLRHHYHHAAVFSQTKREPTQQVN